MAYAYSVCTEIAQMRALRIRNVALAFVSLGARPIAIYTLNAHCQIQGRKTTD